MGNRFIDDGTVAKAFAITPNNGADLAQPTKGLIVGSAGDVAVIMAEDSASVVLPKLAAGVVHPLRVKRVLATGTEPLIIIGLV